MPADGVFKIRTYPSSTVPGMILSAEFCVPRQPKPLCLFFHGWHMTAEQSSRNGALSQLAEDFFVVNVDMRGRGGCRQSGTPDASGFELLDGLDALGYARTTWPEAIGGNGNAYVAGGSGGGGNTLSLIGKAPDIFTAAVSWAGMSHYGLWFRDDARGEFRDEMEGKRWIGGTPGTNPDGYVSRGGLHVLENVLTPVLVLHGSQDTRVLPHHAELYGQRARALGKTCVTVRINDRGHGCEEWPAMMDFLKSHRTPPVLPKKGTLLVHGFLACRSFWLLLESPSRMGMVRYELDPDGNLRRLQFSRREDVAPATGFLLRIPDPSRKLRVQTREKDSLLSPLSSVSGCYDYRWQSDIPWTAELLP